MHTKSAGVYVCECTALVVLTLKTLFSQTMHMIFKLATPVCIYLTYICAGHEVYQIVVAVLTLSYMVCTIIKILFLVSSSVLSTHTLSHYILTHSHPQREG